MATQNLRIAVTQTGAVSVSKDIAGIGAAANQSVQPVDALTNAVNHQATAHAGLSTQAMAMQHSLRSSIEQISQGVPITQLLGQQIGHLSYAMSGEGGLAGAAKSLGQSLAGLLSPVNLLGIGLFGLAIVGLQQVNWMKLFQASAIYVISLLREFISVLPTISPLLAAIGAAMLVAFGPAVVTAVYTLTTAIYSGLIGALAALFTLILSNPLVVLAAGIAYAIVKFNGLQNTIQLVIQAIGQLVEAAGGLKELFGGNGDLTAKGIEIQVNAKQAAADITASINTLTTKLDQSLARAKDYLVDGANKSGPILTNAMVSGGKGAADALKAGTAQAAQAVYQSLNGVPQQVQGAIQAGADYTYNQVTGAYDKSAGTVKAAMQVGGNSAATSVKQALTTGGQSAAQSLTIAGQTVSGDIAQVLQTKAIEIARLITLTLETQLAALQASAAKDRADARATLAGINSHGGGSGSTGNAGGGAPAAANSNSIGSGAIGRGYGVGGGLPAGDIGGASGGSGSYSTSGEGITIINQSDPNNQIAAIDTVAGNKSVINVIKNNPDQIRSILGVV